MSQQRLLYDHPASANENHNEGSCCCAHEHSLQQPQQRACRGTMHQPVERDQPALTHSNLLVVFRCKAAEDDLTRAKLKALTSTVPDSIVGTGTDIERFDRGSIWAVANVGWTYTRNIYSHWLQALVAGQWRLRQAKCWYFCPRSMRSSVRVQQRLLRAWPQAMATLWPSSSDRYHVP
jgi:hypothetical protein